MRRPTGAAHPRPIPSPRCASDRGPEKGAGLDHPRGRVLGAFGLGPAGGVSPDLSSDLGERNDLAKAKLDLVGKLTKKLEAIRASGLSR